MTQPMSSEMAQPTLQVENLTKTFPGVMALDDVSLEVRPHEVVGLIGENGAGKSTLLNILSGLYAPDSGTLKMNGEEVSFKGPRDSARAGIGMVHQEQSLVNAVSVAENIMLGAEDQSLTAGWYRWSSLNRRAQRQLDKIGSKIRPTASLGTLTFAQKQMVELAKALAVEEEYDGPPVIVLDEPTSVLESDDLETLFAEIERLRQVASVVFVSHRLDEVLRVSDRVYVMKDGRCVAERDPKTVDVDELYRLMVGKESSGQFYREAQQAPVRDAEPVLITKGLTKKGCFVDVGLEVRPGEVLGIAGVQGAGREELSRVLFGADSYDAGEVWLSGKRVRFSSPVGAVRAGIGYIPTERRLEGIAQGMSVKENVLLADSRAVSRGPFLDPRLVKELVSQWVMKLNIKTPNIDADVTNLSGGNQQKVILAKWLSSPRVKVLILDHPTRGLDVGAKEDVYALIRELCARDMAIILLGDTLEEVIALSHRVVVMRDGSISALFEAAPGSKPTPVELVKWMV